MLSSFPPLQEDEEDVSYDLSNYLQIITRSSPKVDLNVGYTEVKT